MDPQQERLIEEGIARHRARRRRSLWVWSALDRILYSLLFAGAIVLFVAVLSLIVPLF
jgi:hypothetical protein